MITKTLTPLLDRVSRKQPLVAAMHFMQSLVEGVKRTKESTNTTVMANYNTGTFEIIVFKQGNEEYALHLDQITEVVITSGIKKMPQTPSYIKGVANIRGDVVAVLDLEEKFTLKRSQRSDMESYYTLLVERDNVKMGILLRELPTTLSICRENFDETVGAINDVKSDGNYIKGIVNHNDRMIVVIDIFKVIDKEMLATLKSTGMA
jgi:purine-binding chemotaxis protein CheW